MIKYTALYCRENKVAILVNNQKELNKLKELNCYGHSNRNKK